MRLWAAIALSLALLGCAQVGESRKASIRNVAVVTAISDKFNLTRMGLIVLDQDHQTQNIDFGLDVVARDTVAGFLKERAPQAMIVPVTYDADALATAVTKKVFLTPYSDPKPAEPFLRDIVKDKQIDTILLVTRSSEKASSMMEGTGVFVQKTRREYAPLTPYVGLDLFVIDARTMEVVGKAHRLNEGADYNIDTLIKTRPQGGPAPFLAGFNFPMTKEQTDFLQPRMRALVADTTRELLTQAGL